MSLHIAERPNPEKPKLKSLAVALGLDRGAPKGTDNPESLGTDWDEVLPEVAFIEAVSDSG